MTLFLTSSPSGCPFEPGPDIPVLLPALFLVPVAGKKRD